MNMIHLMVSVLGGLALFVYGMNQMSDGLTQIAGERLKAILGTVTRNRFAAICAGAGVTALIQSSSATSVMTVGFVNAGLLSLEQAIGVIFGANIGTTLTGQLVSFKLSDMALPAVTIGVIISMVSKRTWMKGFAKTILGFGLLFLGMNMMGSELKGVAKLPGFISFFSLFDCTPGASGFLPIGSVLGAIVVGAACTMLVQSSSATIGITIALAEAGLINIWTAVPIVMGDNIGTTVTAALSAIGTNANARRTALAHALFNMIGTALLVTTFVFVGRNSAGVAAPGFFHLVDWVTAGNGFAGENPGRHVAMAHTLFNVANVIILAFFIPQLARLCSWIIRADAAPQGLVLEPRLLVAPAMALDAARLALADMTRRACTVASVALAGCLGRARVEADSIENAEKEVDRMQSQFQDYLAQISQRKLSSLEAQSLPEFIHCVNDAERISDLALRVYRKSSSVASAALPEEVRRDVAEVTARVRVFAARTIADLREGRSGSEGAAAQEHQIHTLAREASRRCADRFKEESTEKDALVVLSVFCCLRDIARHLGNIALRVPRLSVV